MPKKYSDVFAQVICFKSLSNEKIYINSRRDNWKYLGNPSSADNVASKVILIALYLFGAAQCAVLRDYQPDIRYVKVEVDGKQYNLNLKQSLQQVVEDNVPVYVVKSDEEKGQIFTEVEYENRRINGLFYNNEEQLATLLAQYVEEKREVYYDGVIAPGSVVHIVESVPEEWWKEPEVQSSEDNEEEKETEQTEKHEELKLRSAFAHTEKSDKELLETPLTVLKPKIVVAVDYPLYKKLGEDINEVFKYAATYFNAVQLRFFKLTAIDIEISVTGIVIVTDKEINQVEKAKDFFAGKFTEVTGFVNYDATFALTTSDAEALTGKVHLGSICNRLFSTVYEHDDSAFCGLLHTIHDLAHLLNVPHNGDGESKQCSADNTMMAETKQNAEVLEWSECSNYIIKETTTAACLEHGYRYE